VRNSSKAALEVNNLFTLTIYSYSTTSLIPVTWYSYSKNLNVPSFWEYQPQRLVSFVSCENFGEEGLVKTLQHTCTKVPQGCGVLLLPEPCPWQGERMTWGFAHSGVLLALLSILRICLGTTPNWQGLKTSSPRPRPCSPCPEMTGRWHLREKCNGLLVKVLGGLRKTGFNSWLRNGFSLSHWTTYLICLCLGTKPPAPHKTVLRLYLLIFDRCCARGLFQQVHSVGSRSELRMMFENRATYHANEP